MNWDKDFNEIQNNIQSIILEIYNICSYKLISIDYYYSIILIIIIILVSLYMYNYSKNKLILIYN